MRVVVGGVTMAEPAKGFDNRVLGFGLPGIDDVVNLCYVAEVGVIFLRVFVVGRGRDPALVTVGVVVELAITEVAAKQAELPHVIGDVFADVADGAVGAD